MPYRTHETRAVIEHLGAAGDLRGIPELLLYLPPHAHDLGHDAAMAVDAILRSATPTELASFDLWFRRSRMQLSIETTPWSDIVIGSHSWDHEKYRAIVALAAFHERGHVRQAALEMIATKEDAFTIPLLLIRLNDWVGLLFERARDLLLARIDLSHAPAWLVALALLDRTKRAGRRQETIRDLANRVDALLSSPEARPLVIAAATDARDLATRRACFARASLLPGKEASALLLAATRSDDPEISLRACRVLFGSAGRVTASMALTIYKTVRRRALRVLALEAAARLSPDEAAPMLHEAIFDDARVVRELARHALSKREKISAEQFATTYRARLTACGDEPSAAAVEGLAEIATAKDAETLKILAQNTSARIRAAAWVGLARIEALTIDDCNRLLADPNRAVRRAILQYAKRTLGRGVLTGRGARLG